VLIEDKQSAAKGKILLKERFAVLCPTRLLLYKKPVIKVPVRLQQAMAVYPLVNSDFQLLEAPRLAKENLGSISMIDSFNDLNEINNLREFVRISFSECSLVRDNLPSQKIKRDFYFGKLNSQWMSKLQSAKKAIHESLSLERAMHR